MKHSYFLLSGFVALWFISLQCASDSQQADEMLAQRTCGSCHQYPDPSLLDKATWKNSVLPEMAFYVGHRPVEEFLKKGSQADFFAQAAAREVIPSTPLLSANEWERVQKFYLRNAPDSLKQPATLKVKPLEELVEITEINGKDAANITLLHQVPSQNRLLAGNRSGQLVAWNMATWQPTSTWQLGSVPSWVSHNAAADTYTLTLMGDMEPNNLPIGNLVTLDAASPFASPFPIVHNLYRPTHFSAADLSGDGKTDYVVCSFGFHVGKLAWYETQADGSMKENLLLSLPGAIKTEIIDFNNDKRPDILALLAQGDESVYLFENKGNKQFSPRKLLRFPPVYGTSDMILADMNQDGNQDLVLAFGDNGDYSMIVKPYHGIRIFLNDGQWNFTEKAFYPIHGATGVRAIDVNSDGRKDLAVISYFPNYAANEAGGFTLLKNVGKEQFTAYQSERSKVGRWLVQAVLPPQGKSKNATLLLGSCVDTPLEAPEHLRKIWQEKKVHFLKMQPKP